MVKRLSERTPMSGAGAGHPKPLSDPGMNPGAMIVRPSAAGSHKFVAHPCDPCDQPRPLSMLASTNMGGAGERVSLASPSTSGERLPWARRHTAILDAAIELFSERGFQGTTTRSLAAAAGVTGTGSLSPLPDEARSVFRDHRIQSRGRRRSAGRSAVGGVPGRRRSDFLFGVGALHPGSL